MSRVRGRFSLKFRQVRLVASEGGICFALEYIMSNSSEAQFLHLGKFLKTTREAAGLSQGKLAVKLGYKSPQFVSNWERGLSKPPLTILDHYAATVGFDPAELKEKVIHLLVDAFRKELGHQLFPEKAKDPAVKFS
jgi:transcriptional regulator with XRE-family HTH domain